MPRNVEIKAVLKDTDAAHAIAIRICDRAPEIIHQDDIFFACPEARLKLRIVAPDRGELIRYERTDHAKIRSSRYSIARTTDPDALLEILTRTLGRTGTVKKTRTLYLVGQARIHIDEVEGLGSFLELEVVLDPNQSEADGERIAKSLLSDFGIDSSQFVAEAYVDLLMAKVARTDAKKNNP